jgi:hypothetical protein
MEARMSASERAFHDHVGRPDFQLGVLRGRWRVVRVDWPAVFITVTARDGVEWGFRFQLDGYPAALPNACPWDLASGAALPPAQWPRGTGRVAAVFAPNWNQAALYLPCDRLALAGHAHWNNIHPELLWKPAKGIIHYLEIIHELISSNSYQPAVRPAA